MFNFDRKEAPHMDELPERASTVEMPWVLLVALFEQPAVSMETWRGQGSADPRAPAGWI